MTLIDPEQVDEVALKNRTGASGVIKKGKNVQIVYGLNVNSVRTSVDQYLGRTEPV